MPNWIEGTIKLRGKSEDLRRFFIEGLDQSVWFEKDVRPMTDFVRCDFSDGWSDVSITNEPHIRGTRRAFLGDTIVYWEKDYETIAMPIKQAWAFFGNENDIAVWTNISKKFNLDIRLYGFECGMEFCEEIEIIKGEVTINNEIKYDDWVWECPMPILGG